MAAAQIGQGRGKAPLGRSHPSGEHLGPEASEKDFCLCYGNIVLLLVCSLVMNNSKPDGTDNAHGIGVIANMEPLFQGFRTIQSNKGLHRATIQELADSGRAIRRELDSLIAMPRKTHGDSLRIVRQYRRLENIVKFINNGEHD